MVSNVCGTERVIRLVLGLVPVTVGAIGNLPGWGLVSHMWSAASRWGTGASGYGPAWQLLGINTCQTKRKTRTAGPEALLTVETARHARR